MVLVSLLALAACTGTPTARDDTGEPASGDSDPHDSDTSVPIPETVSVRASVWSAAEPCWATVTADLDGDYWWPYGADAEVACDDVAWGLADAEGRCWMFGRNCPQVDPTADPAFAATAEQAEVCRGVLHDDTVPSCE